MVAVQSGSGCVEDLEISEDQRTRETLDPPYDER